MTATQTYNGISKAKSTRGKKYIFLELVFENLTAEFFFYNSQAIKTVISIPTSSMGHTA